MPSGKLDATREGVSLSILAVVALPPWRTGAARVCATLIEALAGRGHNVRALAGITAETRPEAWRPIMMAGRLSVTWFPVPFFEPFEHRVSDEYRLVEVATIRRWLREAIAAERPDAVLIGREIYGLHVTPIVRAEGIPSLLISHAGPLVAIAGGTWPAEQTRLLLEALAQVDLIIAPAHHWSETLRYLGLSRIRVIQNPVDLVRFAPSSADSALARRLGLTPSDVVVVHASNLQAVKRPMDLVVSAERALRQEPRLMYLVVGDGPERESMVRACQGLGIRQRFRFVGWVDHRDMPSFLNLADIVVMMSEHETQALVYLEAQACGRTLLVSDVPGAREVVRDGDTGVLFQTGDAAELANLTLKLAGAAAWRAELGRNARAAVATAHALPDIISRYERTLEMVALGTADMG
jgi:glycosyltransferase involved in cell wall biosynthesis